MQAKSIVSFVEVYDKYKGYLISKYSMFVEARVCLVQKTLFELKVAIIDSTALLKLLCQVQLEPVLGLHNKRFCEMVTKRSGEAADMPIAQATA